MARQKSKSAGIFALYAGEKNIADGTLEEIAAKTGKKVNTLKWYLSPSYKRRSKNYTNGIVMVKIYEKGEKEE